MTIVRSPEGTHWACTDCGALLGMIKDGKAALVTFNDGYTDVTTIEDMTLDHVNTCPNRPRPTPAERETPGEREMIWILRLMVGLLILLTIPTVGLIVAWIVYLLNHSPGSLQ